MSRATPSDDRGYHHGNLRAELVRAGYALACADGPQAATLRAVTRAAGVSPTAAYRHFGDHDDLLFAVGVHGMTELAGAIERCQQGVDQVDPGARAVAMLHAVGVGYIGFALDSPGGFEAAMHGLVRMEHAELPAGAGPGGRTAYQLLTDALGGLVQQGLLAAEQVPIAAIHCWSSVHGFAGLATRGPLRDLPRAELDQLAQALVADVVAAVIGGRVGP